MTPSRSIQEMYNQLLDINKEAFEQGQYEVSYHALAAALHASPLQQNQEALYELEERAQKQRDWIDTHASEHRLSSQSASAKGHAGVYTSLLKQIQARKLM